MLHQRRRSPSSAARPMRRARETAQIGAEARANRGAPADPAQPRAQRMEGRGRVNPWAWEGQTARGPSHRFYP